MVGGGGGLGDTTRWVRAATDYRSSIFVITVIHVDGRDVSVSILASQQLEPRQRRAVAGPSHNLLGPAERFIPVTHAFYYIYIHVKSWMFTTALNKPEYYNNAAHILRNVDIDYFFLLSSSSSSLSSSLLFLRYRAQTNHISKWISFFFHIIIKPTVYFLFFNSKFVQGIKCGSDDSTVRVREN